MLATILSSHFVSTLKIVSKKVQQLLPGTQNFRQSGERQLQIDTKPDIPPLGTYNPIDAHLIGRRQYEKNNGAGKHESLSVQKRGAGSALLHRRSLASLAEEDEGELHEFDALEQEVRSLRWRVGQLRASQELGGRSNSQPDIAESDRGKIRGLDMSKMTGRAQFGKLERLIRRGVVGNLEMDFPCVSKNRSRQYQNERDLQNINAVSHRREDIKEQINNLKVTAGKQQTPLTVSEKTISEKVIRNLKQEP